MGKYFCGFFTLFKFFKCGLCDLTLAAECSAVTRMAAYLLQLKLIVAKIKFSFLGHSIILVDVKIPTPTL